MIAARKNTVKVRHVDYVSANIELIYDVIIHASRVTFVEIIGK